MKSLFILIFFWSCTGQDQVQKTKEMILYCDNLFESNALQILTYAVVNRKQSPMKVKDLEDWADKEYESFVNVIKKNGNVIAYIESPYSESGDWNNVHSYYFDSKGNLLAQRRFSNFYNSVCVDGLLTETSINFYKDGKVILSENEIKDNNGNVLQDTSSCVFNYRFEVPIYERLADIPHYEKL